MSPEQITMIVKEMLLTALEIASPFLVLALVVGLLISLFQAMTQIQEMTLSFVPKMLVIAGALVILFPWVLKIMTKFTTGIFVTQWAKVVSYVH